MSISSAIYFDGYLPTSKRPERIQRLIKLSRDLTKYHSTFPTKVPWGNARLAVDATVDLFPSAWPMEKKAKPPPPPFLVPAVIDALRFSPKFGSLVKLVSGEADGFCAEHVRQKGGTVLTSDSDLLVYDLGESGGVVFLADIDLDMEPHRLRAPQYRPADICRRLSLKTDRGLQYLAFELSRDHHLTLEQAVEKAKRSEAVLTSPNEYLEFIEQYLSPEVVPTPGEAGIPPLDPRVSEMALRSLRLTGAAAPTSDNILASQASNDAGLEMFLPFLLDCPSRTSAWEASKPMRQLAYGLLHSGRNSSIASVSEMRRLQSASSGSQVSVPSSADMDELGSSLLGVLSKIETGTDKVGAKSVLLWVALAIYQDIVMTMDRGKGYPLSLEVLGQDAKGKLDICSWEFLHFLAQAQATFYSLRMLWQVLDFSRQQTGALPANIQKFMIFLPYLPHLETFPSAGAFAASLQKAREPECLSCLQSLCAEYEDIVPLIKSIKRPQDNKKSKKRKAAASSEGNNAKVAKPRSNNPFDLLAGSGE